ncbi:hypothetical protein EsH8_III_000110 [Colletotrichum jinshuiense]
MDSTPNVAEARVVPVPAPHSPSHPLRPTELPNRSARQSSSAVQDEDEYQYNGGVFETEHQDGDYRTTATPAPPPARENVPTSWRALEACEGFDLRTWVAASRSEQATTTASPLSSSRAAGDESRAFARFPDLPYELRSKIWRICLRRPRIVVIRGVMDSSGVEVSGNEFGNIVCNAHWYCENRSPSLFRVCSESRGEALSFFRIHLPMRSSEPDRHGYPYLNQRNPAWDRIYINPDWDLVLYQGASRSLTMPILASDLVAYDPRGEGAAHYGSNDWPKSIWQVNPDPGFGMATLNESLAFLKSFTLCTRSTSDMTRPLGEGYVHAVAGEVGQAGMQEFGMHMIDWTSQTHLVVRTPGNSMIRKALAIGKQVEQSVVSNLVTIELTTRIRDASLAKALSSTTKGWVLQLAWQPPGRKISHIMHLTTGPVTVS